MKITWFPAGNVLPMSFMLSVRRLLTKVAALGRIPTLLLIVVVSKDMIVSDGKVTSK